MKMQKDKKLYYIALALLALSVTSLFVNFLQFLQQEQVKERLCVSIEVADMMFVNSNFLYKEFTGKPYNQTLIDNFYKGLEEVKGSDC